jgi:hypothetical protein
MASKPDVKKAEYWRKMIRDAARSGVAIREFCRRQEVTESQFYWWQRRLRQPRPSRTKASGQAAHICGLKKTAMVAQVCGVQRSIPGAFLGPERGAGQTALCVSIRMPIEKLRHLHRKSV